MRYKVCVYAIAKNEEKFVDRWMDAVADADLVVVVDTGSTDDTVNRLRARGAQVYEHSFTPWRFDDARNAAMDHIPEDVDICVSNDIDEVFEPGWRDKLEAAWTPDATRANYLFTWSHHADGTPNKQFPMEKIHKRQGFRWIHPVHEVLSYNGEAPDKSVHVPGLVLHHKPDLSKPRGQYLPLLELSAKENPARSQVSFWLGREYVYNKQYAQAIAELTRYLALPSAIWGEERSAAARYIGRCYAESGKPDKAQAWLYRALFEAPHVREPYLAMIRLAYGRENWVLLYAMAKELLAITSPTGSYLLEPEAWGATPYDLASIAAYRLGLFTEALDLVDHALALTPEDKRLQRNRTLIAAAKEGTNP